MLCEVLKIGLWRLQSRRLRSLVRTSRASGHSPHSRIPGEGSTVGDVSFELCFLRVKRLNLGSKVLDPAFKIGDLCHRLTGVDVLFFFGEV